MSLLDVVIFKIYSHSFSVCKYYFRYVYMHVYDVLTDDTGNMCVLIYSKL